jgi:predicted porin
MNRIRLAAIAAAAVLMGAPSLRAVSVATVGDTKLDIYGWVWMYGNYFIDAAEQQNGWAGSLFLNYTGYGPLDTHTLPDNQLVFGMQPTRFGFRSTTPTAGLGDVVTDIQYDLNGSNSNLRHAMVQVGDWYFGKTWTTWGDGSAWAETVDNNGPVGQPSFCAPRPLLVKYIHKSGKHTYTASLEQQDVANAGALGSAAGVADRRNPTLIGGYFYRDDWGHLSLHGMGQYFGVQVPATATAARKRYGKMEYAWMVSGDVRITRKDDVIFSYYQGDAVGAYGTGYQSVVFNDANRSVTPFRSIGWVVGYQHAWSPRVRSNVNVSGLHYKQPSLSGPWLAYYYLKSGHSAYANTFIYFNKNVDLGVEYGWERATPTDYAKAYDGNYHQAAHNTNRKFEVSLRARF